jgi:hypothetical protein
MADNEKLEDVESVLDSVEHAGDDDNVTVAEIVEEIGAEAFGPLLLVPSLVLVSPLSGIPGMPTIGAIIITLIAVQIVIGRKSLWLPGFVRNRSMNRMRLDKSIGYLRKPAGLIDRITRKRLSFLTEPPLDKIPALICVATGFFIPVFETVPFSVSIVASAVALFALAMVTKDGLAVILGLLVTAASVVFAVSMFG